MAKDAKEDVVIREFERLGRYRVRVLPGKKGGNVLDVREYIEEEGYTGFTRKGIRLDGAAAAELAKMIAGAVSEGLI